MSTSIILLDQNLLDDVNIMVFEPSVLLNRTLPNRPTFWGGG